MGHERVGFLPKSQRWRDIVEAIGHSLQSSERDSILSIAAETLECVRGRYAHIHNDKGVGAAFGFIIALTSSPSTAGQKDLASKRYIADAERSHLTNISFDLTDDPSPIRLASRLNNWIRDNRGSAEYAEIARRAGADAITNWTFKQRHQPNLFGTGDTAVEIWRNAFSAESFCEISRS